MAAASRLDRRSCVQTAPCSPPAPATARRVTLSVYDSTTGIWTAGPDFPNKDAANDAPAALEITGDVIVEGSPFSGTFSSPAKFYEWDGTNLTAIANPPNAVNTPSFVGHLLLLPNGQIMYTDFSTDVEFLTSAGTYNSAWQPTITSVPSTLTPGSTYSISGTQFNGLSQANAYGDDFQDATNYPLVQIVNTATGHVFYAKTHGHSTMGVATGSTIVSTNFDVPAGIETGASSLFVIANGIPSAAASVTVGSGGGSFTLAAAPKKGTLAPGSHANAKITATPSGGFTRDDCPDCFGRAKRRRYKLQACDHHGWLGNSSYANRRVEHSRSRNLHHHHQRYKRKHDRNHYIHSHHHVVGVVNLNLKGPDHMIRAFLGPTLQGFHGALKVLGDSTGIAARRQSSSAGQCARQSSRPSKLPARLFHFKQSHNPHRQHRNAQIIRQQSNPCAERIHLAIRGVPSFRKHQHTVSTIHGLTRVCETLPESRLARQRETNSAAKPRAPTAPDQRFFRRMLCPAAACARPPMLLPRVAVAIRFRSLAGKAACTNAKSMSAI